MSQAAPSGVQRIEISTTSADHAREFIDDAYGAGRMRVEGKDGDIGNVSYRAFDAGGFRTSELVLPADVHFAIEGRDELSITIVTQGWTAFERDQVTTTYGRGDIFLVSCPGVEWRAESHRLRCLNVILDASLLDDVAGTEAGDVSPNWRPWSYEPLRACSGQWRRTATFVDDLLAASAVADAPLVTGAAGRLLAASALALFPSSRVSTATVAEQRDARPETMRRAISYIEANPDQDISIADIARAARVTPRAVQLAFRRHLDTTPLDYLRRVRLEAARSDLRQAPHRDGETVTAIAYRWGFSSPSRFAAYYRTAFGCSPSETLRDH